MALHGEKQEELLQQQQQLKIDQLRLAEEQQARQRQKQVERELEKATVAAISDVARDLKKQKQRRNLLKRLKGSNNDGIMGHKIHLFYE